MHIANPIYDVAFKRLMQNERIAKFFISTILDTPILTIQVKSREFTYEGESEKVQLFRLDFIATIETPKGAKKVLIEVQKSRKPLDADIVRFRHYLGEQYSKDKAEKITSKVDLMSIITIYILGFNLPEIKSACFRVGRSYTDLLSGETLTTPARFMECLTHDSYCIQVRRIGGKYQTRLERLLSIFEQRYFVDKEVLKDYPHGLVKGEALEEMVTILYRAGSSNKVRRALDLEAEAWAGVNELTRENIEKDKVIQEKEKVIQDQDKVIEKKDKSLQEKDKVLQEKEQALQAKNELLIQTQQEALEKEKTLQEQQQALQQQAEIIAELRRKQKPNS